MRPRPAEQIDLVADLNARDDDGYGWSILSHARDQSAVKVGAMLSAGNSQAVAVVRVVAVDDDGQVRTSRSCPRRLGTTVTCSTAWGHHRPGQARSTRGALCGPRRALTLRGGGTYRHIGDRGAAPFGARYGALVLLRSACIRQAVRRSELRERPGAALDGVCSGPAATPVVDLRIDLRGCGS